MVKTIFRATLVALAGIASCCSYSPNYNPAITREELFAHIDFLASDSLQGRQPGTPFDRVAAKYIKDQFDRAGLTLMGKNGYQFFEFIIQQSVGSANYMHINGKPIELGKDYSIFSFSTNDTVTASAVFVGYGIQQSDSGFAWNDYLSVNVVGKWAVMLRDRPKFMREQGLMEGFASAKYKAQTAMENGAVGVIFVSGFDLDQSDRLVDPLQKQFDVGIPVIQVKRSVMDRLLHPSGRNVASLEHMISRSKTTMSFPLQPSISVGTDLVRIKRNTQNVLGIVEGTDPKLKHQYVVVGAHYDHIGFGGSGSTSRTPDTIAVHSGADDNASGVAAMIELAQQIAFKRPKRSVLFIAFGAEELGLLGSRYFVDNPLVPLDSISAMLNLDMVGRLDQDNSLKVMGVASSLEAESILLSSNHSSNIQLKLSPEGFGPSDHASFYLRSIPVLFFTTGPHADYHTPNDKPEGINFDGLTRGTQLIYNVANTLANLPYRLAFSKFEPYSAPTKWENGTTIPGIIPEVSKTNLDGLKVLDVKEHSPAYYAGIRQGDIIIAINGMPIKSVQNYASVTQNLIKGSSVSVEVVRNGEAIVMLVLI